MIKCKTSPEPCISRENVMRVQLYKMYSTNLGGNRVTGGGARKYFQLHKEGLTEKGWEPLDKWISYDSLVCVLQMYSLSNLSEGWALSMVAATTECSLLNFSNAFLLVSSFCLGSVEIKVTVHLSSFKHDCKLSGTALMLDWSKRHK